MLNLNYRDSRPIYEQVRDGLRRLIITGAIPPGDRLPSVRAMAGQLAINPNTIQRAYEALEQEGYACSVPGKGSFAALPQDVTDKRREELLEKLGDVAATEGRAKYNALSAQDDRDIYKGLTFWSPNVNIFRDPRWGRGHETYGEDPYLTGELGKAFVEGIQGDYFNVMGLPLYLLGNMLEDFGVHPFSLEEDL